MNMRTRFVAVLASGAVCAMPALAQDTGTTEATHGNTTSQGVATSPRGSTPLPGVSHTISASAGSAGAPSTRSMGAGPQGMSRSAGERDVGWIGLLGLFGLLGLRRRRHDDLTHRAHHVSPG